jgi:GxxExxY protein
MNNESNDSEKLLFKQEVYAIQGAVFEVYREMGCGFLEAVYQECLEKELLLRGIPFVAQAELKLGYKGEMLEQTYRADIICYGRIILELKAVKAIVPEHQAQMLNYLKATGHRLGLIINFAHHPKAEIQRFAR